TSVFCRDDFHSPWTAPTCVKSCPNETWGIKLALAAVGTTVGGIFKQCAGCIKETIIYFDCGDLFKWDDLPYLVMWDPNFCCMPDIDENSGRWAVGVVDYLYCLMDSLHVRKWGCFECQLDA